MLQRARLAARLTSAADALTSGSDTTVTASRRFVVAMPDCLGGQQASVGTAVRGLARLRRQKVSVLTRGIEPRTVRLRSGRSTTELYELCLMDAERKNLPICTNNWLAAGAALPPAAVSQQARPHAGGRLAAGVPHTVWMRVGGHPGCQMLKDGPAASIPAHAHAAESPTATGAPAWRARRRRCVHTHTASSSSSSSWQAGAWGFASSGAARAR